MRRRVRALLFAICLTACGASQPAQEDVTDQSSFVETPFVAGDLSAEGLGPIRIGMRADVVRSILGDLIDVAEPNPNNPNCAEWSIGGDGVSLLLHDDAVARISAHAPARVITTEGVGIGSIAAQVRAAYPHAERESAEYTPDPGHELFVWTDRDNFQGLRFEIAEDETVSAIHAGGDLRNIEGCVGL